MEPIPRSSSSSTGVRRKRRSVISTINVTPFVDVMLVLLIVFMITSPMIVAGVDVNLPSSSGKAISEPDAPISVTVDKGGAVYLNNTQIAQENLVKKLVAVAKANKSIRIFVRGDRDANYGKVVKVMGMISEAGFSKIALVTDLNS